MKSNPLRHSYIFSLRHLYIHILSFFSSIITTKYKIAFGNLMSVAAITQIGETQAIKNVTQSFLVILWRQGSLARWRVEMMRQITLLVGVNLSPPPM